MINKIKQVFIGSPLPNSSFGQRRLNKLKALADFSPDALSSVAYANQEIYLGLMIAGSAGLSLQFPVAIAIVGLLVVVALSYTQTIYGYPSGGGSYVVARENLGTLPGLIAGAALMVSYILTAAVSLTAGVAAISSAFPQLYPFRVSIALVFLLVITLLNLRGLQESGTVMTIPVYGFVFFFILMILVGGVKAAFGGVAPVAGAVPVPAAVQPLSLFLVLHAFASGCTALTGIEAISNNVPVFKSPESSNAAKTLIIMAALMGVLFLGSIGLTQLLGVVARQDETILSALSRTIFGGGIGYFLVQFTTMAILAVAANTSFAGFPRVAAILAQDRFVPRQLAHLGDRLVFTNGILLLAGVTALLIVVFNGDSHALVPLFAVGAFSAFTLSQSGMVRHWLRSREKGWRYKSFLNGLGATITGSTVVIIGISKFLEGAWISIFVISMIVVLFYRIRKHYDRVAEQISLHGLPPSLRPLPKPRIVIPVSGVHRGLINAVNFARSISNEITAVYVDINPESHEKEMRDRWNEWFPDIHLVVLASPYRSLVGPLLQYLDQIDREYNDGRQAVLILPELILSSPWEGVLHNQATAQIRRALLYQRRVHSIHRVIIDVPHPLK